jgi:Zn ribbon nucleic-acid-binding protein
LSKFIKHTSCPKCGSRDNLAEYDDHVWCFGCKYYKLKNDIHSIRSRLQNEQVMLSDEFSLTLSNDIPLVAKQWLLKYGITNDEIQHNNIAWDAQNQILILHYTQNYWQGRCFGNQSQKYLSKGSKPLTIYGNGDTIVCVEDILSAIKIARLSPDYCATPLLGSSMSLETTQSLSERFKSILIWLDRDKAKDAIKIARNLKQRGINSDVVISPKDPKEYTKGELLTWLKNR